jgi:hypothetical protein
MWIDREHVVTGCGQRLSDSSFMAATDLEHPPRRLG